MLFRSDKILKSKPETKDIPVIFITEPFDPETLVAYVDAYFKGEKIQ